MSGREGTKKPDVEVAIVGTGFSGLCMAIQLRKAGRPSFVVLEKDSGVGGTWRANHYPGCACDVQSHLYSYSFEPNPHWSRMFAPQGEIRAYLERCADKYGILPHIRFNSEVTTARFDERDGFWHVEVNGGERLTAQHLVLGVGALSRPAVPAIEGLERFRGHTFHSAEWDHDHDLTGKTVGVIGTGASAIQFVPQVAGQTRNLHLFQRTPPWVLPKPDRPVTRFERWLFSVAPFVQRLFRAWIYWLMEARGFGFTVGPWVMKVAAWMGRRHIRRQVRDPALRRVVTPTYTPGCKRILMADDYYPALERPNVEVVTDGISHITERGVVTADGTERPVDTLIFGTGFRVGEYLAPMRVVGRGGVEINQAWRQGAEAYLGTVVSGFPNLYLLMGPNTGLGHNSMVFMIEAQVDYVMRTLRLLDRRGARLADVRSRAQREFNERLQPRLARSVWASGCQSWYLDDHGKNSTLWPGFTFEYWLRTRRIRLQDYDLDPAPANAPAGAPERLPQPPSSRAA
ncbi:MAG: flavin-containing monooxygenase [Myxococcota bacterium]